MKDHKVDVFLENRHVGTLAETPDHRVAFAYTESWLENGFAVSPFSLPLEQKVFVPASESFGGLWGVFADSLPDAWGRLLVDRLLRSRGLADVSVLDRLAIVGGEGMGALTYRPAWDISRDASPGDLDDLAARCAAVLRHDDTADPDELFRLGGSSGGARPKVMTGEWIIKFPASGDIADAGVMEKEYMDCAAACGIDVPETKLMPSRRCSGYFAVRRFDRVDGRRRHMLTASAILETDPRTPSLDYHTLMKLTAILSRSSEADLMQMYRRMCFNVYAHNRDDHAKNFSFLMREGGGWELAPVYDLTGIHFSDGDPSWGDWQNQHALSVNGKFSRITDEDILAVGERYGLGTAPKVLEQVRAAFREDG